jgi:Archaeal holliday junction resolvase (hjc)
MVAVITAFGCRPAPRVTRGDTFSVYPRIARARRLYAGNVSPSVTLGEIRAADWLRGAQIGWVINVGPLVQPVCWRGRAMSGRRSRSKGARTERSIVNALQANGFAAVRVPLSGAVGGRFAGDIVLPLMGRDLCVEVKARADGFRELYSWLNERDVLIVKADRQEPLVILRLSLAAEIAKLTA